MSHTYRAVPAGLASLILAAACSGGGTSTGPNPAISAQLNRDVAEVVADASSEDADVMADPTLVSLSGGFLATTGPTDEFRTGACVFTDGRFLCPTLTFGPFTFERSFAFFDASGVAQSAFDADLTASANFRSKLTGDISRDSWSASIERTRDLTASGLLGAETQRTWNGTGTSSISRVRVTDGGTTRTYDLDATITYANVVVALPRSQNPWPLSGTVTRTITVTITAGEDNGRTITRTATVTFNGTSMVPLTIGDSTFTIDLANRRIRRPA